MLRWALVRCLTYNTFFWQFSKFRILSSFLFIQKQKRCFWNFWGQNHETSKIRDLVEFDILRVTCVLHAFPFNSLPFMDSQTIATFGSEIACSDVTKTLILQNFRFDISEIWPEDGTFNFWQLPKFGAAAPRQTGVITRRKKWERLTPPPPPQQVAGRRATPLYPMGHSTIDRPRGYTITFLFWWHFVQRVLLCPEDDGALPGHWGQRFLRYSLGHFGEVTLQSCLWRFLAPIPINIMHIIDISSWSQWTWQHGNK